MIKLAYKNLLEGTTTVSLTSGTAHASYPLYRLYDRKIGLIFQSTAAETIVIHIDQGASNIQAADRLIIPVGHNLDGETLDIEWSDNDSAWTPAVTQWTGDSGAQIKSWSSISHRYWRFTITSPSSAVEIPELFLTQTYEFEKNPSRPVNNLDDLLNVTNNISAGGQDHFLINGDPKKRREYIIRLATEAQKTNLETFYAEYGGSKPFWLFDLDDEWIYGKLSGPLSLNKVTSLYYDFNFPFLEVIA
jgi:hypothetical protein